MADNNVFELKIITPETVFYDGGGTFLEFTSVEGQMGIYKEHVPLTTILEPCVMKIHNGEDVKKAVVLGGFVEILKHKVTVLAEDAEWPEDIDVERAQRAKERAEERIAKHGENVDVIRAEASLKRALARLEATK